MTTVINITIKYKDEFLNVECNKDSTVLELKNKIYEKINIDQNNQILTDENDNTLVDKDTIDKLYFKLNISTNIFGRIYPNLKQPRKKSKIILDLNNSSSIFTSQQYINPK